MRTISEPKVSLANIMNNNSSDTFVITRDKFTSSLHIAFELGRMWVLYNEGVSSNQGIFIKEALMMNKDVLDKIDSLDLKYDAKIDKIFNKLDEHNKNLGDKIDSSNIKISDICTTVALIGQNVNTLMERAVWWKQYLLTPVIAGAVVGAIVLFFGKFIK